MLFGRNIQFLVVMAPHDPVGLEIPATLVIVGLVKLLDIAQIRHVRDQQKSRLIGLVLLRFHAKKGNLFTIIREGGRAGVSKQSSGLDNLGNSRLIQERTQGNEIKVSLGVSRVVQIRVLGNKHNATRGNVKITCTAKGRHGRVQSGASKQISESRVSESPFAVYLLQLTIPKRILILSVPGIPMAHKKGIVDLG